MPTLTDDDQKSAIDQRIEDGHGAYASAGIDQLESLANDPSQHSDESVKEAERAPDNSINYTGSGKQGLNQPKLQRALKFAKKRGGIIGLISLFGIGGGILAGFFGPASMLINMTENFSLSNDSSSSVLERRFMKIFGNMTESDTDVICNSSKKNIKCKMGKISNSALKQLGKKGIIALDSSGNKIDVSKKGYPDRNPASYLIDGEKDPVPASKLREHLSKNPRTAAKILGVKGAFNLRVKAWTGKHISQKFYKKFSLTKAGGIADGVKNKYNNANEKLKAATEKLVKRIPGVDKLKGISSVIDKKISGKLKSAKGGGIAYTIAAASCVASKAPAVISAGVAGLQLLRLLPVVNELVLSPGSKAKASGVDTENSITAEDMDTIGTLLTNKTKDSDGNNTSALDSPYLLAAMGVNKNKPAVSKKFAPGYSVLTDETMVNLRAAGKAVEPACNVILSPITMFTFLVVESAITKTNPIGAVVGLLGGFAVSLAAEPIVSAIMNEVGTAVITNLAESDNLDNLQGRELGDALGVSASAFFASGSMARNLPALTNSQLVAFRTMQEENQAFQRDMDIASLSPFDTSSRYTFMGSILYNTQMAILTNGGYTGSLFSILSGMSRLSLSSFSPETNAATNYSSNYCGYADEFGLTTENEADTPAVNMAGLPCTGITPEQDAMSSNEAIDLMIEKGWLDSEIDVKDDSTIDDLMSSGVIKGSDENPTPLYTYIKTCSDASTGDYLFEMSGCTVKSSVTSGQATDDGGWSTDEYCTTTNDEGESEDGCDYSNTNTSVGTDDTRAYQAMSVFLLDFQAAQSINGEDEEVFTNNGSSNVNENSGKINPEGWAYPMDSPQTFTTYEGHSGNDIPAPEGSKIYSIRDGVVKLAEAERFTYACPVTPQGPIQNNIEIESVVDGKTYLVRYAHLKDGGFNVKAGDTVKAGDLIGYTGNTGCSSGPHLHVDITVDGVRYSVFPVDIFGWSF